MINVTNESMRIVNSTYGRVYSDGVNFFYSASTVANYGKYQSPHIIKWLFDKSGGVWEKFLNLQSWESRCGSAVHDLFLEGYLKGKPVDVSSNDPADYVDVSDIIVPAGGVQEIRNAVQSAIAWCEHNNPEVIAIEKLVGVTDTQPDGSPLFPFCGRVDLVARVNGKVTLLDLKTSKMPAKNLSYQIQLSIYTMLWNVMNPEMPIEQMGVIHANKMFKSSTPPKSVLETIPYKFDEDLVWDVYRVFTRCYDGFNKKSFQKKADAPTVYLRGNE